MTYCYYIAKNLAKIKRTKVSEVGDLVAGERIIAFPTNLPVIIGKDLEGPYLEIKHLIKYSKFYNFLKVKNSKRAAKIIQPEYIIKTADLVSSPKGQTYSSDFMQSFVHSVSGTFTNENVTGIHFYDELKVRVIEVLETNENGVWKAKIEAFDYQTKKWKEKIKPTDFFPKDWDKTKLLEEINFANQFKKLKEGTKKVFESITKSGVNVIFIVDNEKIKTVYPIIK